MSSSVNILRKMVDFEKAERLDGYSKVTVIVSDDIEYSAGTDTGRTLTLSCPWGTQQVANNILAQIRGFQYQPMTVGGGLVDPAAEIGDGIRANNVYSGVFSQDITYNSNLPQDIAAPADEELDEGFKYVSKTDRKIQRQYKEMQATFAVQASQIAAEVSARETQGNELRASLNIQADRISQEVSDRKAQGEQFQSQFQMQTIQISAKVSKTGGNGSSFEWTHDDNKIIYKANGSEVFRIDASGAKVTGEIRATSGKIGGFDIKPNYLSYNGQTWGGTNTTGAYLGTSGLQLGKNFKVDMQGNLNANSGTFAGTVHARRIDYGGDAGYFSGSGLSGGSVYGSKIAGSTLGTSKFTGGVNSSLANADFANGVFNGWNTADYIKANAVNASSFRLNGTQFTKQTISFVDGNGNTRTYRVLMEASG